MTNLKKYNTFIFLTTFAKSLVEVFIPMILFNLGLSIKEIHFFYILVFVMNLLLSPIASKVGEWIDFKWIAVLSSFLFAGMYYYLSVNLNNIYTLALLYSCSNTLYYLSKHNYADAAIDKKKIGVGVGSFLIVAILAGIPASYIGSFLIDKIPILVTTLVLLALYLIGCIPLFFLKYENHKHTSAVSLIKQMPKKNILYFAMSQFKVVFLLFYPLHIYISVSQKYSFIGILNIIVGIASIAFIYFYAKKMDEKKNDYMMFSAILLSITLLTEINIKSSLILLFTSFIEGISTKLYETSNARDFYFIDDKTDKSCYFMVSELLNNGVKLFFILIMYLFNVSLYWMLMIWGIGIFLSGFVKFESPKCKV